MNYDVIIIGGGPGGYTAAIRASQGGLKTALIEKKKLGGTCLNLGCIPTKSLLNASKLFYKMTHAETYGIYSGNPTFHIDEIYAHKNQTVEKLVSGIQQLIEGNNIDYFADTANFIDEHQIHLQEVNQTIEGKNIIIATGSKPRRLRFEGSSSSKILTSDDVLSAPVSGNHICILGGGVIGVELADFYSNLNYEVTIIESEKQILSTLDRELSLSASSYLKKKGIQLLTDSLLQSVEEAEGLTVHYQKNNVTESLHADILIQAIGRSANTEGLNLEVLEIDTNRGFITVNNLYQTKHKHIYAIGDVSGSVQLAHVASTQGKECVEIILDQNYAPVTELVPYCIYTGMEIAYVGLNEQEAKEKGLSVQSHKILMNTNGRHLIETEDRAFIKVISNSAQEIVGAALFCQQATELISYFTLAIQLRLKIEDLETIIFPHPTISEAVGESFENIMGKAIHQLPKRR